MKVRYEVPSDRAVPLSVNKGAPAVLADPAATSRRAIEAMAKGIFPKEEAKRGGVAPAPELRKGGLGHGPPRPPQPQRIGGGRRPHLAQVEDAEPPRAQDPYAELKTRVHHEVIATLGAELFKAGRERRHVGARLRAVTEQLTLDRTPLTREERRQLVREITDDILGYGPLEPFLRDDSVTEVMVNAYDRIYVERQAGSSGRRRRSPTTRICCASSTRSCRRSAGASTSRRRWSTPAFPTARV